MNSATAGPVFAGVDGSAGALAAVRWAAADAALRGKPLRILHADERDAAPELLERARRTALDESPSLTVDAEVVPGDPAAALTTAAARANGILVVGRRGRGAAADLLLGSVSRAAAGRAACPVVVVSASRPTPDGRVVVGMDGSDEAFGALAFAYEEAGLRGARLIIVQAVAGSIPYRTQDLVPAFIPEVELRQAREQLSEWTAPWRHRDPGMDITMAARPGNPADVLQEVADGAGLLVVGSRGQGRVRGMLLGSVSQALLGRFPGPVAVVGAR